MSDPAFAIRCFDLVVTVAASAAVTRQLADFFVLAPAEIGDGPTRLDIAEAADGHFTLAFDGAVIAEVSSTAGLIEALTAALLARASGDGVLLHGGAVGWNDKAVIVTGEDELAVTMTICWLVERGFSFITQGVLRVGADNAVTGFAGPLAIPARSLKWLTELETFRTRPSARGGPIVYIAPDRGWSAPAPSLPCAAVVFAGRVRGQSLRIGIAEPDRAAAALAGPGGQQAGLDMAQALVSAVPTVSVRFDSPKSMDSVLDRFVRMIVDEGLDPAAVEQHIAALSGGASASVRYPVQGRTERRVKARLTIGMACYDDFDGAYFSLMALRMYHAELMDQIELILIDNHPDGPGGKPLKDLDLKIPNYRYIPNAELVGTAVRDQVFREAAGEIVLCMDCHVLFEPGALAALLAWFDANPDSRDLIQGPIVWEELNRTSSHWEPVWQKGMFGTWGNNPAADDPAGPAFEIPLQGLGMFACRRDAWPGFNPAFAGFGGEEGYIHEKFRQRGGKVLCLPALRWLHRFARPLGVPYPINWRDRFRNYLLGWQELGLPTNEVIAHGREHLGKRFIDDLLAELAERGEFPVSKA